MGTQGRSSEDMKPEYWRLKGAGTNQKGKADSMAVTVNFSVNDTLQGSKRHYFQRTAAIAGANWKDAKRATGAR